MLCLSVVDDPPGDNSTEPAITPFDEGERKLSIAPTRLPPVTEYADMEDVGREEMEAALETLVSIPPRFS